MGDPKPPPPPVAMPPALLNFFLMKKRDQRRKSQLVWLYPDLLSQFFAARHCRYLSVEIFYIQFSYLGQMNLCIYLQFQTCKFPAVFIALYKFIVECTSDVYFVHTYFHCMASVCPQQQPECYWNWHFEVSSYHPTDQSYNERSISVMVK